MAYKLHLLAAASLVEPGNLEEGGGEGGGRMPPPAGGGLLVTVALASCCYLLLLPLPPAAAVGGAPGGRDAAPDSPSRLHSLQVMRSPTRSTRPVANTSLANRF
jgi:hypothetical protein